MRMTPVVLVLGGLLIFAPVLFMFVVLPWITMSEQGFGLSSGRAPNSKMKGVQFM